MEATIVDGNGTETGHIIVTTIGGRNGQPKQVFPDILYFSWTTRSHKLDWIVMLTLTMCDSDN